MASITKPLQGQRVRTKVRDRWPSFYVTLDKMFKPTEKLFSRRKFCVDYKPYPYRLLNNRVSGDYVKYIHFIKESFKAAEEKPVTVKEFLDVTNGKDSHWIARGFYINVIIKQPFKKKVPSRFHKYTEGRPYFEGEREAFRSGKACTDYMGAIYQALDVCKLDVHKCTIQHRFQYIDEEPGLEIEIITPKGHKAHLLRSK